METTVRWLPPMSFVAETGSGHAVVLDGAEEHGGRNLGPRPMEMLLVGLGGCSSFDVMLMLQKSRQTVTDCQAKVSAERASSDPKIFTKINIHFIVTGHAVDDKKVARAVKLSAEKYCSASIMLGASAEMTHSYEIQAAV